MDELEEEFFEMTFDNINHATGFANGDLFESEEQVYKYFTREVMEDLFGYDFYWSQELLDDMAWNVIDNRWHMVDDTTNNE